MEYLDFEEKIHEIEEQINQCKSIGNKGQVDVSDTLDKLNKQLDKTKKEIYGNLTPWQKVQLSRHTSRPYTLFYMENMTEDTFVELHGDRQFADDKAMIGGMGKLGDQTVMFIGQQKGVNTKMRQYRNFGMPNPEGYRKALRLMKLAEKFNIPIVCLIDTPGAFCGLEAEERGQGEAIARNIYEMFGIEVPIVCVVIGEGASGGALGIGVGDKVFMLENTWYSVISPESCSSILWRSWDYKKQAAIALKLTASDNLKNGLIDGVIKEPLGGAHYDPESMAAILKQKLIDTIDELKKQKKEDLISKRIEKFSSMGQFLTK